MQQLKKQCNCSETGINEPEVKYKCNLCKDTGFVLYTGADGYTVARDCPNGCRTRNVINGKIKFADIPEEFKKLKINNFNTDIYSGNNRDMALMIKTVCTNYVKDFREIQTSGKGFYFYSAVKGSGKTRMAISVANEIINKYIISCKFTTAIRILDEIKNTWNSDYSERKLINEIIQTPVLIIDDIGIERPTDWVNEKLYDIINSRMISKKITIFTSNRKIEELKLDDRIMSRISKMAVPLQFPAESVRDLIAAQENTSFLQRLIK